MSDINTEWVEKSAQALHDMRSRRSWAFHEIGKPLGDTVYDDERRADARAALEAVADDLRAEGAAQALREAADALDREEAEEAAKVRMGNVRCLVCELEWNQRGHFGCHGDYHEFDGADFSRAGEVRIEETYAGQFLRARADRIEASDE